MLNIQTFFKPITFASKLCSIPEIPDKYSKDKIQEAPIERLKVFWEEFESEILEPSRINSGKWEHRYNVVSLIEKVAIVAIMVLGCTQSHYANRLKTPVIILEYSKLKIGITAIAAVSITKFTIKSVFIYHKRLYSAAQSRNSLIHRTATKKMLLEKKSD